MGQHAFSMDPRAILGVGPDATLEEIQDAYHAKSKKHHPDVGGDEWAFRMVVRAYEVLKTTTDARTGPRPWEAPESAAAPGGPSPGWTWAGSDPFQRGSTTTAPESDVADPAEARANQSTDTPENDQTDSTSPEDEAPIAAADPDELRTVNVELIWTRFELDSPVPGRLLPSGDEEDNATLSVCMVVSWPPPDLVDDAAQFASSGEILHTVIARFEQLRGQGTVVAGRSRIEDGRFVGWLSYPDVLTAQDAILTLRDTFKNQGFKVKLQTRDARVPFDGHRTFRP